MFNVKLFLLVISDRLDTIHVGSKHLSIGGLFFPINKIISHENYIGQTDGFSNDIALIKIRGTIVFSRNVQPIHLKEDRTPGGENLKITGWGFTKANVFTVSEKLKELKLKSLSDEQCEQKIGFKTPTHICTFRAKDRGVCMVRKLI